MAGLKFGRFELHVAERLLLAEGRPVRLGGRAFDMLVVLADQDGRIVDRDTLLARVWPGRSMAENNLSVQVAALRKVLGQDAVRTVAGRGYCLALPVETPLQLPVALVPPAEAPRGMPQALGRSGEPLFQRDAPVLLYAELQAAAGGAPWMSTMLPQLDRALRALVPVHGGQWQDSQPPRWVARFYSVRDALACCREVHGLEASLQLGLAPHQAPRLLLALHRPEGPVRQQLDVAARLAALGSQGLVVASAAVANQFIPALDGDLLDMGEQFLGAHLRPQRVYGLVPGRPEDGPGRVINPASNLRPTVAVVPPRALGDQGRGDTDSSDAIGDILTDQVIAALSRSQTLNVISRLSTQPLRDRALSAPLIARILGAQYVVSGHCVPSSQRIKVLLTVAEGHSGRVLDSIAVEDQVHAVLHTDSDLVRTLAGGIARLIVHNELQAARQLALPSLGSHTLMLAGVSLMFRLSRSDFEKAHQALEAVRQRAPHHPLPLVWLARWHLFRLAQGSSHDRAQDGRMAIDLARRALDIDPDSSLALTMMANAHITHLRDLDGAEALCESALAQNPNESLAWLQKGNARSFRGDGAGALADTQRAVQLSPLDPARHYYTGLMASAALTAKEFGQAIVAAREALKLNREHLSTHRVLAIALSMSGRMDEARNTVKQLLLLDPTFTVAAFLARSPGTRSGLAEYFGQALLAAGVPPGP